MNWKRHRGEGLRIPPVLDNSCKDHEVGYLTTWHENRRGLPSPYNHSNSLPQTSPKRLVFNSEASLGSNDPTEKLSKLL